MNIRAVIVVIICGLILGFLGLRDLPYLASNQGRCLIGYQPSILLGAGTSWEAALACENVQQ